jgi:hypothetical protein
LQVRYGTEVIVKQVEKVVYKHIFNFLMENALIYKFQSEFFPGHPTTHQLIELINEICMALDNRELICFNLLKHLAYSTK